MQRLTVEIEVAMHTRHWTGGITFDTMAAFTQWWKEHIETMQLQSGEIITITSTQTIEVP